MVLDAVNEKTIEIENDDVQKQSEKDENILKTSKDILKNDILKDSIIGKIKTNKTYPIEYSIIFNINFKRI